MPDTINQNNGAERNERLGDIYCNLVSSMRGTYHISTINLYIIFACYILYKLIHSGYKGILVYDLIYTADLGIEPSILQAIYRTYNRNAFEKSTELLSGLSADDLKEIVEKYAIRVYERGSGYRAEHSTPETIVRLASRILDIRKGENVADICSGNGNFLCEEIKKRPDAYYIGYEIDMNSVALSKIRADMLGHKLAIEPGDAIVNLEKNQSAKYDKIFCNYPFGMRIFGDTQPNAKYNHLQKNSRYDWLFNTLLCNHLAENGKGVSIVASGSLWNAIDKEARKYFVDNGYIEAIISLPAGAFGPMPSVETSLIVFSNNNQRIRFVNASNYYSFTEARKEFSERERLAKYEIDKIMSLFRSDADGVSFTVDNKTIKESDYDLSFKAYYSDLPEYENGAKIGDIAKILRGTIVTRNTSSDETDNLVLKLSNLQGALIDDDLEYISEEDVGNGPSLEAGDIIISRTLNPIKVAIFGGKTRKKVFPSGNMFVLRTGFDVDPYYLLSFLLSDDGKKALEFAATGTTIKVLSASSLEKITFPNVSRADQEKIAVNLKSALLEVSTYKYKLARAEDKLRGSFYERGER